ncbi:purine-nucleoside phosphorylase [Candidatus Aerophobetes bacterium]|nr:purine-nucleoside phosphorylase [Candidatus Aerophobetes bacterium]
MAKSLKDKINEATNFIQSKRTLVPDIGIILGTGLGGLADHIQDKTVIPYNEIPYFATSTAPGHTGNLIMGMIADKKVVAMQGRFHTYEGYSLEEITFPVRVMRALGIKILIESNAAGGMNRNFKAGDAMIIADHINFTGQNPLIGANDETLGSRFPDMSEPYDEKLMEIAEKIALEEGIRCHRGVYIGVSGPNFETKAEYRFFQFIGADAVGMSTVPEVIVARHSDLKVLGISCITDICIPDRLEPVDFRKVIEVANRAEPRITRLVERIIREIEV